MAEWLQREPLWLLGLALFAAMVAAAWLGGRLSRSLAGGAEEKILTDAQEGYVVTSVYTLVGLLIALTFAMAVDRYEGRRALVLEDANAIETLYLRAQLLEEPHRSRFSNLLIRYADNHVQLAQLTRDDALAKLFIKQDQVLLHGLWTLTIPAFDSIRTLDFSSSFVDSVNDVIRIDAQRRALRRAQIPPAVIAMLMFYSLVASGVLGSVMKGRKGAVVSTALIGLSVLSLLLVADINRPVTGTIRESQEPMQRMLDRLKASPPASYRPNSGW